MLSYNKFKKNPSEVEKFVFVHDPTFFKTRIHQLRDLSNSNATDLVYIITRIPSLYPFHIWISQFDITYIKDASNIKIVFFFKFKFWNKLK